MSEIPTESLLRNRANPKDGTGGQDVRRQRKIIPSSLESKAVDYFVLAFSYGFLLILFNVWLVVSRSLNFHWVEKSSEVIETQNLLMCFILITGFCNMLYPLCHFSGWVVFQKMYFMVDYIVIPISLCYLFPTEAVKNTFSLRPNGWAIVYTWMLCLILALSISQLSCGLQKLIFMIVQPLDMYFEDLNLNCIAANGLSLVASFIGFLRPDFLSEIQELKIFVLIYMICINLVVLLLFQSIFVYIAENPHFLELYFTNFDFQSRSQASKQS